MEIGHFVVAALAVLVGSTGIAGFLTAGVQWTRAARLRRAIDNHAKLIDAIGQGTPGGQALAYANQADSLRLAATSLIRVPQILWRVVATLVLVVLVLIAITVTLGFSDTASHAGGLFREAGPSYIAMIAVSLVYIVALVVFIDYSTRRRRERFVRASLVEGKVTLEDVRKHDYLRNRLDDSKAESYRRMVQEEEEAFLEERRKG